MPLRARVRGANPAVPLVSSFLVLIVLGTGLLMLPFATADGTGSPLIIAFFTATSAATVTGHVLVDTAQYWSFFGLLVILLLVQVGGFGIMTGSTLLLLLIGHKTSLRERLVLGEALGGSPLGFAVVVVRRAAVATALIEAVGAVLLTLRFGASLPPDQALWWGVFHAISSFNNAGFDLTGQFQSLLLFQRDVFLLAVIAVLVVLGGLGHTVLADLVRFRHFRHLTLDTKLVLMTSGILWLAGAATILLLEMGNAGTLGQLPLFESGVNALFLSVSARTAGFTTVNLGDARDATLILLMALMFIGGGAGSTAGGIKVNTFAALFFTLVSSVKGRMYVEVFRREIPQVQVYRALSVVLLAIALLFVVGLALAIFWSGPYLPLLFDAISAFGTVGLSTGATQLVGLPGHLVLALTMIVGRLGPLTVVLALAARERVTRYRLAEEQVKIG